MFSEANHEALVQQGSAYLNVVYAGDNCSLEKIHATMMPQKLGLTKLTIWSITKFSVLFIYQMLSIITATEECYFEERSHKGIALLNHTYKSLYTEDYPGCLTSCANDLQCKSLNYWWHTSQCDLNNRTKYSAGAKSLKWEVSSTFMELKRETSGIWKPCKFDFEDGISGWKKTGTAFDTQPTFGDNPIARDHPYTANPQGDWWIGTHEIRPSKTATAGGFQGDAPQGTLTSPFFNIRGQEISFLIGGGCDVTYVRAELVINDQAVRQATGDCHETMTRKTWNVRDFIGLLARVRLVDVSSGTWGHINFDDLKGEINCQTD